MRGRRDGFEKLNRVHVIQNLAEHVKVFKFPSYTQKGSHKNGLRKKSCDIVCFKRDFFKARGLRVGGGRGTSEQL